MEFVEGYAENIPLKGESVDSIILTWTLCSVNNIEDTLQEAYRVLKTDGKVVFIEHGKAQSKLISKVQNIVTPLWSLCAGGCRLNRSYFEAFEKVGFSFTYREQVGTEYRGVVIKN